MLRVSLLVALLAASLLAGCIQADDPSVDDDVQTDVDPLVMLADLPDPITGVELFGASEVPTGSGIWVDGDHAYVGARASGFYIADISEPSAPKIVSSLNGTADEDGGVYARDVDLIHYDDGRKVAVLAGQSFGMYFIDVTDPATPTLLSIIVTDDMKYDGKGMPTHNVDVVTGTTYVFNAPSGGLGRSNHLIDAADPENPVVLDPVGEHGCHDITFFMDDEAEKHRAYCAGRDITEIWDLTDLSDVKILTQLDHPVVDNGGGLHHLAMVNQDASILIIGDEFQGGGGPGCQAHVADRSTPIGALWFFDIAGEKEKAPEELSHFSPTIPAERTAAANEDYLDRVLADPTGAPEPDTSCTSHFGSFIGDTAVLAMGWYHAGVVLIDLSDPSAPTQIGQFNPGTNTWDVKYHRGVLVTGDMTRGLDVLKLV